MGLPVVNSALLMCSFGVAPSPLTVLPGNRTMFENSRWRTIMDNKPFVNIKPFGVCISLANPITAAQTAAAFGVLTPGACTPMCPGAVGARVADGDDRQHARVEQLVAVHVRLRRCYHGHLRGVP